jgi:hypothetical protein
MFDTGSMSARSELPEWARATIASSQPRDRSRIRLRLLSPLVEDELPEAVVPTGHVGLVTSQLLPIEFAKCRPSVVLLVTALSVFNKVHVVCGSD